MGVPDHLLIHTVTLVRPASTTNGYGDARLDYGAAATRTEIAAWVQQDKRAEPLTDGRDPLVHIGLLITNHEDVDGRDRAEFDGTTYEIEGPPEKVSTPAGFHHTEATLRVVKG